MRPDRIDRKYLYIAVSAVTCVEVALCVFMTPVVFSLGPHLMAFLAVMILIGGRLYNTMPRRESISVGFLAAHVVALAALAAVYYLAYNVCLAADNPALALIYHVVPVSGWHLHIWPKSIWVFAAVTACYYSLMASVFSSRSLVSGCAISLAASAVVTANFTLRGPLWWVLCNSVAASVCAMLRLTGFKAVLDLSRFGQPVVGTGQFCATILDPCSGMEGITAFEICYAALVVIIWKKMNKIRAVAGFFIGVAAMYVLNLFRIYALILIGHYGGSHRARELWHSQGSAVFYGISLLVLIILLEKWIAPREKDRAGRRAES